MGLGGNVNGDMDVIWRRVGSGDGNVRIWGGDGRAL